MQSTRSVSCMRRHFTIHNSENDCIVRIVTEMPDAGEMRLLLGGKAKNITLSDGVLYHRAQDNNLPQNFAATSIIEGEGHTQKIFGNVIIIAQNGLHIV